MQWMTIREVSVKTNISDPTLRRYIRDHGQFIKTRMEGHILTVSEESIPIIIKIRQFYLDLGWKKPRVQQALEETYPMNIVLTKDEERGEITVGETIEDIRKLRFILSKLVDEQQLLREEIKYLRNKLDEKEESSKEHQLYVESGISELLSRKEKYMSKREMIKRLLGFKRD